MQMLPPLKYIENIFAITNAIVWCEPVLYRVADSSITTCDSERYCVAGCVCVLDSVRVTLSQTQLIRVQLLPRPPRPVGVSLHHLHYQMIRTNTSTASYLEYTAHHL